MKRRMVIGPNSNIHWNLVMIMGGDVMFMCSHLFVINPSFVNVGECSSGVLVCIHVGKKNNNNGATDFVLGDDVIIYV